MVEMATTLSSLHYDTNGRSAGEGAENTLENMPAVPPRPAVTPETRTLSAKTRASSSMSGPVKTPATVKTFEMPLQPLVGTVLFAFAECVSWISFLTFTNE